VPSGSCRQQKDPANEYAGTGKRLMQHYLSTESDDRHMDFSFTILGVAERINISRTASFKLRILSPLMLPLTSRRSTTGSGFAFGAVNFDGSNGILLI
jgi:hypothetical protein